MLLCAGPWYWLFLLRNGIQAGGVLNHLWCSTCIWTRSWQWPRHWNVTLKPENDSKVTCTTCMCEVYYMINPYILSVVTYSCMSCDTQMIWFCLVSPYPLTIHGGDRTKWWSRIGRSIEFSIRPQWCKSERALFLHACCLCHAGRLKWLSLSNTFNTKWVRYDSTKDQ